MALPPPESFEDIYREFDAPPAPFDCGAECAPKNGGIPFCCDPAEAVPVVYRTEWAFLKSRTDMWRPFRPRLTAERRMVEETHDDHRFVVCNGPSTCDRPHRSISCRMFPFYPYLDNRGRLLGLVTNDVLEGKCVLVGREEIVTPEFRREFLAFWQKIFALHRAEHRFYIQHSQAIRRARSRKRKSIVVITEEGEILMPRKLPR